MLRWNDVSDKFSESEDSLYLFAYFNCSKMIMVCWPCMHGIKQEFILC